MMATLHPIASKSGVDRAWSAFQSHVQRALETPPLLGDHAFMEEWARREKRFKTLFGMECAR